MARILTVLDRALLAVAIAGLVLMLGHVTLEVVLRLLGVVSQLQTITFVSAWYMVAVVFCALPYAAKSEGHISVDLFTSMLPDHIRHAIRRISFAVIAICLGLVAWLSFEEAWDKTLRGEIWETSTGYFLVWPGRWAVALAFTLLALRNALRFLQNEKPPQKSSPTHTSSMEGI